MSAASTHFALRRLSRPARFGVGIFFALTGLAYGILLMLAYFEATAPSSLLPDLHALDLALFGSRAKPLSPIERLLAAAEGPMNSGGTMRPAFTAESAGWDALVERLSSEEQAALASEREGERLALLDWVRAGASRAGYEHDEHPLGGVAEGHPITAVYLSTTEPQKENGAGRQVRIRSLINDRCASCHSENGRNEKARSFPLDTYDNLERHCQPEAIEYPRPTWLIAAFTAQLPLALLAGLGYCGSAFPRRAKLALAILTLTAAILALGSWQLGQPGTAAIWLLLLAFAVATTGIIFQLVACLSELCAKERA